MTNLAVVGCGAVTEFCHLPAAALAKDVAIVALVDSELNRARALGKRFGISRCATRLADVAGPIDGVIVAVPNHAHASVAREAFERRTPVLLEKPMALTASEARELEATAETAGTLLQIGYMYRYCAGAEVVRECLRLGALGRLRSFSVDYGGIYDWPVSSNFIWSKTAAGGGVLIDMGSHCFDLLHWWFGEVSTCSYADDALGGVEADCTVSVRVGTGTSAMSGRVRLSRIRALGTIVRVVGEHWTVEYDLNTTDVVTLRPTSDRDPMVLFHAVAQSRRRQSWDEVYARQLETFVASIRAGRALVNDAASAVWVSNAIDQCYERRQREPLPWLVGAAGRDAVRVG